MNKSAIHLYLNGGFTGVLGILGVRPHSWFFGFKFLHPSTFVGLYRHWRGLETSVAGHIPVVWELEQLCTAVQSTLWNGLLHRATAEYLSERARISENPQPAIVYCLIATVSDSFFSNYFCKNNQFAFSTFDSADSDQRIIDWLWLWWWSIMIIDDSDR